MKKIHFPKASVAGFVIVLSAIVNPFAVWGATWADNGAYTISWYDKNQVEFDISTPQELAGLAYLVNNNFADFSGKKIHIKSDIDLSGKDWIPIGLGSIVFQGSVEGNNHTIYNVNITTLAFNYKYGCGIWIKLQNSEIRNLNFKGAMDVDTDFGFIADSAESSLFDNINVDCDITYKRTDIGWSTSSAYSSQISGMIGNASNCTFSNIKVNNIVDYTFGRSDGHSCYGYINLNCGGILGSGSDNKFFKCHAINQYTVTINGYVTTTTYTKEGSSFITYGGIVGYLGGDSSKVIGCLAENKYFEGNHSTGTFDTTFFRFGGVVGSMSKYCDSVLKNCVAINNTYKVRGHAYTWQSAWYHTNSSFGGVAYEVPKNYGGCYSNNDVSKNVSKVEGDGIAENGSISFSESQMHTQSFVDELNFYSQLEFDDDYWTLDLGKLSIKRNNDEAGISLPEADCQSVRVYSMQGLFVGNSIEGLKPGIYIITTERSSSKIIIR